MDLFILQIRIKFCCKNYDLLSCYRSPVTVSHSDTQRLLLPFKNHFLKVFTVDGWYDGWYEGTMRDGCGVASLKTVTGQNQNIAIVNV